MTGDATIDAEIVANRTAIIDDVRYGMSSEANLTIWIAATLNDSTAIAALQKHVFSGDIYISSAWLTSLTESTGTIAGMITLANSALISGGYFANEAEITAMNMAAEQLAGGMLLNDTALALNATGYNSYTSVMSTGMEFLTQPEIT